MFTLSIQPYDAFEFGIKLLGFQSKKPISIQAMPHQKYKTLFQGAFRDRVSCRRVLSSR